MAECRFAALCLDSHRRITSREKLYTLSLDHVGSHRKTCPDRLASCHSRIRRRELDSWATVTGIQPPRQNRPRLARRSRPPFAGVVLDGAVEIFLGHGGPHSGRSVSFRGETSARI